MDEGEGNTQGIVFGLKEKKWEARLSHGGCPPLPPSAWPTAGVQRSRECDQLTREGAGRK